MSPEQTALEIVHSWDPGSDDLPDWVVERIDGDPELQAAFDARFDPFDASPLQFPDPGPLRLPRPAPRRTVGLVAAAALLAVTIGLPLALPPRVDQSRIPSGASMTGGNIQNKDSNGRSLDGGFDGDARLYDPRVQHQTFNGRPIEGRLDQNQDVHSAFAYPPNPGSFDGRNPRPHPSLEDFDGIVAGPASLDPNVAQLEPRDPEGGRVPHHGWRSGDFERSDPDRSRPLHQLQAGGRYTGDLVEGHLEAFAAAAIAARQRPDPPYTGHDHRAFSDPDVDPLSTFAIDVDTASYSRARRQLSQGYLPAPTSVRPEEFVNALPYDYGAPAPDRPFHVAVQGAPNPFNPDTHLLRIGLQGRRVAADQRKAVHLTFLVDTSGSMQSEDKIGLVKHTLAMLTRELRDGDTVSIVAYAGSAGLVLPPTPMSRRDEVLSALHRLRAGGSTAMGAGLDLAYQLADQTFHDGAVNRVIVLSDGDANVGVTDPAELTRRIRRYAAKGITLTTAGFGSGSYNDHAMEQLANDGDGQYVYIDSEQEARRVFVDHLTSTLEVIAKDVKIQVAFDPAAVAAYRLVGYDNRAIADADFRNDAVDAGEVGSGHRVTALYEVALRPGDHDHLATVQVRAKAPGPDAPAVEWRWPVQARQMRRSIEETSSDFRIALAAAALAEALRNSPHLHGHGYDQIGAIARGALRPEYPEDLELLEMIRLAQRARTDPG